MAPPLHKIVRARDPVVMLRERPDASSRAVSALLYGEDATEITAEEDFIHVICAHDGYEGWLARAAMEIPAHQITHTISVRASPVFPAPDIKTPVINIIPFASRVSVQHIEKNWAYLADGSVLPACHIIPLGVTQKAGLHSIALKHFMDVPYIWGGRSSFGLDCSGLVQLVYAAIGLALPRDSGPQRHYLTKITECQDGSIACFKGHIGIMADSKTLLHANATAMAVTLDPLAEVIKIVEQEEGAGSFYGFYSHK